MYIIDEPEGNVAGVGVADDLTGKVPGGEDLIAICQLWPSGNTDEVYVQKEDIPALVRKLEEIREKGEAQ